MGCFEFGRKDGTTVHGGSAEEGISVPDVMAVEWIRLPDVKWILVIEKEVIDLACTGAE